MEDTELQATVDYLAITRLQNAYADVVTRRAWPELGSLFIADAVVRVDTVTAEPLEMLGPGQLGEFIGGSIEKFEFFQFVILNSHIELDGEAAAKARVFISELRQERESGHWSQVFGLYQDRYRKVDGRWLFARRDYNSLARTARNQVFDMPRMH